MVPVDVSGTGRTCRVLAEQRRLPRLARRHGIQLLHSPGSSAPLRPGTVSVVTIHDLIYARLPTRTPGLRAMGLGRAPVPTATRQCRPRDHVSRTAPADGPQ